MLPYKLIRLLHTIKYLKPTQLAFFVIRRKLKFKKVIINNDIQRNRNFNLHSPILTTRSKTPAYHFLFLNKSKTFSKETIDWCPKDTVRLWRYNLHYFDYLRETNRSENEKNELIKHWINNNPQDSQPGWEPFTTSLRIVNWIFYLRNSALKEDPIVINSLYTQTLWLEKNDERHILANHYFENLKALAFAGTFFSGKDAERWKKKSATNISLQLKEQTLADGGHFERSPQYHALMLENYLDLLNLTKNNATSFNNELPQQLTTTSFNGLVFLNDIIYHDETLPLFNDSANGIAPTFSELYRYAAIFINELAQKDSFQAAATLVNKETSGLYGYRHQQDLLIIDCGEIGPDYQPGHTHCDMLSYELMLAGEKLIVDTGVSEYEPGPTRHYLRSTKAHNTISIDNAEQSEIWGEFRVARRAKKLLANIEKKQSYVVFTGAYRGFPTLPASTEHQREIKLALDKSQNIYTVNITDTIKGKGEHTIESRVHFHPDSNIFDKGNGELEIQKGQVRYLLQLENKQAYRLEETIYCPEFGKKLSNQCLIMTKHMTNSSQIIRYQIKKI